MVRGKTFPELRKIFSALELPMREDESIDDKNLKKLVEYELSIGVEGFYCMGSSGEGLLLSLEERKKALELIVEAVHGRVPVIAHIGTIRTEDVIDLAKHAMSLGIHTVSMIPPYYYKFSMDEIMKYYEDVIRAVPGLRVIVYNIPQFTGIEFSKQNAGRLLDNPAVIGVKHTSTNLYVLERMIKSYPEKVFFNGFDEQFLGALSMGADAAIGTTVNCYAPLFIKLRALYEKGDCKAAYEVQHQINERVECMVQQGIFSAVKYVLSEQGVPCGKCRKPFQELTEDSKRALQQMMEADRETE
jgi:hypothetical protein